MKLEKNTLSILSEYNHEIKRVESYLETKKKAYNDLVLLTLANNKLPTEGNYNIDLDKGTITEEKVDVDLEKSDAVLIKE